MRKKVLSANYSEVNKYLNRMQFCKVFRFIPTEITEGSLKRRMENDTITLEDLFFFIIIINLFVCEC